MKTLSQVREWFINNDIYDIYCETMTFPSFEEAYRHSKLQMINDAFTWNETDEGYRFWEDKHDRFIDFWDSTENIKKYKPLYKKKDSVRIKRDLSNEIIEINDDMLDLCNKKATILIVEDNEYVPNKPTQDGAYYYIKEDEGINVWTSEMFKQE